MDTEDGSKKGRTREQAKGILRNDAKKRKSKKIKIAAVKCQRVNKEEGQSTHQASNLAQPIHMSTGTFPEALEEDERRPQLQVTHADSTTSVVRTRESPSQETQVPGGACIPETHATIQEALARERIQRTATDKTQRQEMQAARDRAQYLETRLRAVRTETHLEYQRLAAAERKLAMMREREAAAGSFLASVRGEGTKVHIGHAIPHALRDISNATAVAVKVGETRDLKNT